MHSNIQRRVRTTVNVELRLNREDLLTAVRQECKAQNIAPPPKNATVEFHVPGGADWSHTDIDINDDNPVIIHWTEEHAEGDI